MSALPVENFPVALSELVGDSGLLLGSGGVHGRVSEMSWELCFAYAAAFLRVAVPSGARSIALGMDLRPSSPAIASACAAAIRHAGMSVDFCGPLLTAALAFYARSKGIACIMVTGRNAPPDCNGIKFYGPQGEITLADEQAIGNAQVYLPAKYPFSPLPAVNPAAVELYSKSA